MPRELELKLSCDPELVEQDVLGVFDGVASVEFLGNKLQHDSYFDSRSRSLARAGLSARCRRRGRRRQLDVKPVPILAGVVMDRAEISAELPAGRKPGPAVRRLVERQLPIKITGVPVEQLVLRTRRRLYRVTGDGWSGELCFDRSTAQLPGRRRGESFSELELELTGGDEHAFRAAAAALAEQPGLVPAGRSKYQHALELLELPGYSYGPPKPTFGAIEPADEVARAICSYLLAMIRAYEPGTRVGLDPEQLHKMRVATRRLRAALALFSACFDRRSEQFLKRNVKWLADVLGEVRDLDVQQLEIPRWRAALGAEPQRGWELLAEALRVRWSAARERLLRALDSERYHRLIERAEATFARTPRRPAEHPGKTEVGLLAARAVRKRARKFAAAADAARSSSDVEDVHQLRIAAKKLRYTGELVRPIVSDGFSRRLKRLSRFQDALGYINDVAVTAELARSLRAEAAGELDDGDYLYVLGELAGYGAMGTKLSDLQMELALRELGGKNEAKALESGGRRLGKVARRLAKKRRRAQELEDADLPAATRHRRAARARRR